MSKVLYIKANPKSTEESHTFKISEAFIQAYKEANPNDEIITLDLYNEDIRFLDHEMITKRAGTEENVQMKYAKQFASADKYIVAAPMWNLFSPAILKAYIDYVMAVGVSFKYTERGPIGLLADQGKKAVHISAVGGNFTESESHKMGDNYLRTIFGFMGITDFTSIITEMTGVLQGEALASSVNASVEKAKTLAKTF